MFHLGLVTFPVATHLSGTWQSDDYPFDRDAFDRPETWIAAARSCEEGCYDFTFAADTLGIFAEYQGSRDPALRRGIFVPAYDQGVLADYMAAHTSRIGVVATMATTAAQPYRMARRLASMDHLSGGRIGWNVVTGTGIGASRGLGLDEVMPHDERYDFADEFVELCRRLWDSWDEDALVLDRERDLFVDPAKVHDVEYEGKYVRSFAPLNVHRSPQGGPLLAQAGASPRGVSFAARWAELCFSIRPTREGMRDYYEKVKTAVSDAGRDPDSCKVMFCVNAFVGDSEGEAEEKRERHFAQVDDELGMILLSGTMGIDFSALKPDEKIVESEVPGARNLVPFVNMGYETAGEAARALVASPGYPLTGTPEQIADEMAEVMEFVGGDGLMLHPLYLPNDLFEFNQKVVPLLKERGLTRTEYSGATLRDNLMAF